MKYIFENEIAIELYCKITKELGVKMCPGESFKDEVYLSEKFLMDSLTEVTQLQTNNNRTK